MTMSIGLAEAIRALETAATAVAKIQSDLEARDVLISMSSVPDLVADLVRITKRQPSWHLGHLSGEDFELVRQRLGATAVLAVHQDGSRFLVVDETHGGLRIQAQTTGPAIISSEHSA